MKPIVYSLALISLLILSNVSACVNTLDDYASEVLLNKPGIDYNLNTLSKAYNLNNQDGSLILQSSYNSSLALILTESEKICDQSFCEKALSVRLQIPTAVQQKKISYLLLASSSAPGSINSENIESYEDWEIKCDNSEPRQCELKKDNIVLYINQIVGKNNSEVVLEISDSTLNTCLPCSGKCISSLSGKFCISSEKTKAIESVLKHYGVLESFNQLFTSYSVFQNGQKTVNDLEPEITFNGDLQKAMEKDLRWLRQLNVLHITDQDILLISALSKAGKAGENSLVFYSPDDNQWEYYYESPFPILIKIKNCQAFSSENIPKEGLSFPKFGISTYYVIPIATTLLLVLLFVILLIIGRYTTPKSLVKS